MGAHNVDSQEEDAQARIGNAAAIDDLEALRVSLLGKSGLGTEQLKALGKLAPDERKQQGERENRLQARLQSAIGERRSTLEEAQFARRLA